MSKINKPLVYVLALVGGLLLAGNPVVAASAEKQLEKGIEAFRNNDNDKAMDYFVDVLMNGNNEQVARANNYIDAIHNQMGGIESPKEVAISFPDQPTQTIVDPASNLANYGTERLNTLATEAEAAAQEAIDALNQPKTLTEQIEARQLANYLQDSSTEALPETSSILADEATVLSEQPTNGYVPTQQDLAALSDEATVQAPTPTLIQMAEPAQTLAQEQTAQPFMTSAYPATQVPTASSTFADLTSPAAIEARNLYTAQKLQSLTDEAAQALDAAKGVHLYMRTDGRPDAIDIDDGVLFQGNSFRPESFSTLNRIYELTALTQGAHYTILPSGSYTDDVTLNGIRQAMALKSYLVKRGISQGKVSYNMGLVDEEVPAKYSNLKGLSIVFDYDAKLPTRLLDNEGKETNPLLSMAIVPQCHALDRSLGEAYAVDFSVLETVNPLDNWVLQVVWHGRDGKYYVVRQLEGFSPVYHQILWNGRKGIIGPELPCGKYTFVLTGVDLKGNKQTLRRRVVVKCEGDAAVGSCQCKAKSTSASTTKNTVLNYKSARLWKKPGRIMRGGKAEETVQVAEVADVYAQGEATRTEENTYTHTKTVRNIVTEDNSPAETVVSTSYTTEDYAPGTTYTTTTNTQELVNNPYSMPYEEEYTTYTN